ncbi:MAG TPA: hypothetical protein VH308_07740 [Terracidiphilus sp.]|nr:hypothetical protein [Terracidiphilus sp.]
MPLCSDFARIAFRRQIPYAEDGGSQGAGRLREGVGSDIWWIRFKVAGVEHREKVGRRGDAIKLYKIRKADILRGVKMPANMKDKGIRFSVLAKEAIDWYVSHDRRDVRNFKGRLKFIVEAFGDRIADESKPSEIDAWIGSHKWSSATKNRYRVSI